MRILILCTGNSCRSQMAHGFLQSFDRALTVRSAGTEPARRVHPLAVKVMAEAGIDISTHVPQHVDAFSQQPWDYVVTVCGRANAICPAFTGSAASTSTMSTSSIRNSPWATSRRPGAIWRQPSGRARCARWA